MIETFDVELPTGIRLNYRSIGRSDAPLLVFLHGFPEGAFIWDQVMQALSSRYRCVAPDLRGYGESSAPAEVNAYRISLLAADIDALAQHLQVPVAGLVAHDWGGAVAWALAAQAPAWLQRLVIINSPHPATFLRELQRNPAQQQASAYMNFLCRPDAEELLAAKDFERMWPFFTRMGAIDGNQPGAGWLTEQTRDDYRKYWERGLRGALNYYRASPLRPPTADDTQVMGVQLPPEMTWIPVPTLVLWAEADAALPPALLDGLQDHVPDLRVVRIPQATHWVIHEQPQRVVSEIEGFVSAG
ncbi:MAG: alpha/beta hydrolase [Pseudoxanthomonas sp.]